MQSDDNNWLRMLPPTAVSVRVSFYAGTAQQLAPAHPVVQVSLSQHGYGPAVVTPAVLAEALWPYPACYSHSGTGV
jgi:hypothetical protein